MGLFAEVIVHKYTCICCSYRTRLEFKTYIVTKMNLNTIATTLGLLTCSTLFAWNACNTLKSFFEGHTLESTQRLPFPDGLAVFSTMAICNRYPYRNRSKVMLSMEDYEENTFDPNKNVMEIGWKMFSYEKSSDDATQVWFELSMYVI